MILTANSIANAILTGAADEDLHQVYEAFSRRSKLLRQQKQAMAAVTLRPGARCRVKEIRPKYLVGQIVIVEQVNRTRAHVKWEDPTIVNRLSAGRYGGPFSTTTTVPVTCLEEVR